jgi:hypothetical protein
MRASRREMVSPSPVPPNRRVVDGSACVKGAKQLADHLGRHPDARVRHLALEGRAGGGGGPDQPDPQVHAPDLGELDRVRQQVGEDLPDPRRIGVDPRGHGALVLHRQGDALVERLGPHEGRHVRHQLHRLALDALDGQLPGLDLREVEDVVDQAEQPLAVAPDGGERALALGLGRLRVGEQVRIAEDRRHRRPDLVAHVRQELRLAAVRLERDAVRLGQLARLDGELGGLVLRSPTGLLDLLVVATVLLLHPLELRDVARETARVHERAVLPQGVRADQDVLDRAVPAADPRFEVVHALVGGEPRREGGRHLRIDVELRDRVAHVLVPGVAEEVELGLVHARDDASASAQCSATGTLSKKSASSCSLRSSAASARLRSLMSWTAE